MQLQEWYRKTGLTITVYLLAGIVLVSTGLVFFFENRISVHASRLEEAALIQSKIYELRNSAAALDRAAGNARVAQNSASVQEYETMLETFRVSSDSLRYHALRLKIANETARELEGAVSGLVVTHREFISALQQEDSVRDISAFNRLPVAVEAIESSIAQLKDVLTENNANAAHSYTGLINPIQVIQVILLFGGVPFLIGLMISLRNSRVKLLSLNREIDDNNRKYVFDSKEEVDYEDEEGIKARLLTNLKKASGFIQHIANGNYDVRWEGMNDTNRAANQENIAGELLKMREQMKSVRDQDEIRIWATEGLSRFGEIIRKHQDNFDALADNVISSLVKYVNAKVGGLFIVEEEDGAEYLLLRACYAYDRKKYITKRQEIGTGMVGQTYQEGFTIHLTEIPKEYMMITSGLGVSNPRSLLLIPLQTNDRKEGVLELASLQPFKAHEIEFLEKLGEMLASSIASVRTAEKTKVLLVKSQEQSEQMRAQEEEMRQNMEELEATQEQMGRQVSELNSLKESLEEEKYLFGALMDNLPESVYFKSKESKFIRVSKYMADHFGAPMEALIGKSDFDFQDEAHAKEAYDDEQNIIRTRQAKIDFVEKEVKEDGSAVWVSTTKMPLVNLQGQVVGTFGVSRDVTNIKKLELEVTSKEENLGAEIEKYKEKIKELEDALRAKEEKDKGKKPG